MTVGTEPDLTDEFPMAKKAQLRRQYLQIGFVVSAYWIVSISLVFINKYLLSDKTLQLDAPLFTTWFQCVVTVAICISLTFVSRLVPSAIQFNTLWVDTAIMLRMLPLSLVFIAMIVFNNLCLKHVGVAFYYIGRSQSTVFNVILTYIVLRQKTSCKAVVCCAVIVFGFILGVDQEGVAGSLSVIGVVYGVLASFFVALFSIYIKKGLPLVNNDVAMLTYYNNINASLLFIPLIILFGELGPLNAFAHWDNNFFWTMMVTSGAFGFAIGYLTSLQVQVTSPLTNNISGTAKACAQTVIACIWYNDSKPLLWWTSNAVVLFGSAAYARIRQLEMQRGPVSTAAQREQKKPLTSTDEEDV